MALTPMAGLAIGMTQPIYDVAPDFGADLAAIVASGIAMHTWIRQHGVIDPH